MKKSKLLAAIGTVLSIWSTFVNGQTLGDYLITEEVYPDYGVSIGQGWQKSLGQPVNSKCVVGKATDYPGSKQDVQFYDTFDRYQMQRALKVSAKASYGMASGSGSFTRNATFDRSRQNVLAVVTVSKGMKTLGPPDVNGTGDSKIVFTQFAKDILNGRGSAANRLAEFQRQCGDTYVSSLAQGGRLSAMFNTEFTTETLKEHLRAKASASSGGFSGSASVSSSLQTELQKGTTQVKYSQDGGELSSPISPADLLTKIRGYAGTPATTWSTTMVYLTPYRTLPDWPPELRGLGITEAELQAMAAHQRRVIDLANLYADAAYSPSKYYFPFDEVPSPDVAAERASGLYGAAQCLEAVVTQCSLNATCDTSVLSSLARATEFCRAEDTLTPAEEAAFYSSMVKHIEKPQRAGLIGRIQTAVSGWLLQNPDLASTHNGVPQWSFYDTYYKLLATAPMVRVPGDVPRDEAHQVQIYCQVSGGANCVNTRVNAANGTDPTGLRKAYIDWVLGTRMAPLAGYFCSISSADPMCRDVVSLRSAVTDLTTTFGPARNFSLDPVAEPVVTRGKKPKKFRIRIRW